MTPKSISPGQPPLKYGHIHWPHSCCSFYLKHSPLPTLAFHLSSTSSAIPSKAILGVGDPLSLHPVTYFKALTISCNSFMCLFIYLLSDLPIELSVLWRWAPCLFCSYITMPVTHKAFQEYLLNEVGLSWKSKDEQSLSSISSWGVGGLGRARRAWGEMQNTIQVKGMCKYIWTKKNHARPWPVQKKTSNLESPEHLLPICKHYPPPTEVME